MKTDKNILIAFVLNLLFSVFEFIGGIFTGSVAIISDAIHDIGDAMSIGLSFLLEKKSKKQPDDIYTYGYARYSVMGSVFTTLVLLCGSFIVIYNAALRIIRPVEINYNGMVVFAVVGVVVNFAAAVVTHGGRSLNQKAVSLHMLEDVLGWIVVLIGALIMKYTDIVIIDPVLSICVAFFIVVNATKNLKEALELFLEKIPDGIIVKEIKEAIIKIDGIEDVHHIHIWSMDGTSNYATMHIVSDGDMHSLKDKVKKLLTECGIAHSTLEFEAVGEICDEQNCCCDFEAEVRHHHHHHHH